MRNGIQFKKRVSGKADTNVVPRPHLLTIVIGMLSPTLSVVALFISYVTYQTSLQTTQIAQKAYLGLTDPHYELSKYEVSTDRKSPTVFATFSFSIINAGNTPARIRYVEARFYTPAGWTADAPVKVTIFPEEEQQLASVSPRIKDNWIRMPVKRSESFLSAHQTSDVIEMVERFTLTSEAWKASIQSEGKPIDVDHFRETNAYLQGVVLYSDMFGSNDMITWCWEPGHEYPTSSAACSSANQ